MFLPDPLEIGRSIGAVVSLARGDAGGLARLDLSFRGFWRSFGVAILVLPFALFFTYAERRMWPTAKPDIPVPQPLIHYIAEVLAFVVYWEALPLAMILITRQLHLTARFVPFIVAWNWSNVVTALLLTPPIALYLLGIASTEAALVVGVASTLLTVVFQASIAKITLGISAWLALGIAVLNLAFGLALAAAADFVPFFLAPHAAG